MKYPEAILFDLDGVLLNTEPILEYAWSETSKKYDYILLKEKLDELKGRRRIDCAKKVLEWIGKDISIDELLSIQKSIIIKQLYTSKSFEGAEELINFCLKIRLPIALVTSSSSDSFKIKSSVHPWLDLFPIKILGDSKLISAGKPSPDPYIKAAEILGVNRHKTWVIEDSYSGALSGLRAGCNLYLFSKDIESLNKLQNEYPLKEIQQINELAEIIYFLKLLKGFK